MFALMGPLTRTGRDYKNQLILAAGIKIGDTSIEMDHCRLEIETDTKNIVQIVFRGYHLVDSNKSQARKKALLIATASLAMTRDDWFNLTRVRAHLTLASDSFHHNKSIVAGVVTVHLTEIGQTRLDRFNKRVARLGPASAEMQLPEFITTYE